MSNDPKDVYIAGQGDLSHLLADALEDDGRFSFKGFVSDKPRINPRHNVIDWAAFKQSVAENNCSLMIGQEEGLDLYEQLAWRRCAYWHAVAEAVPVCGYIHPDAKVSLQAKVHHQSIVLAGVYVERSAFIHANVFLKENCYVTQSCRVYQHTVVGASTLVAGVVFIGPRVLIGDHAIIRSGVTIHRLSRIEPGTVLHCDVSPRSHLGPLQSRVIQKG